MGINAPCPIAGTHDVSTFDCGDTTLNDWLQRRAMKNENNGASRITKVAYRHSFDNKHTIFNMNNALKHLFDITTLQESSGISGLMVVPYPMILCSTGISLLTKSAKTKCAS